MMLTLEQQKKVEENMGLVGKVISDKVHEPNRVGLHSYEDLFQIGCIGLCKAAATDKGGTFSTYAYRLIWNEICDALIYSSYRQKRETTLELERYVNVHGDDTAFDKIEQRLVVRTGITLAKGCATPFMKVCIDVCLRMSAGEPSKEIAREMGITANQVTAYASKGKKFLRGSTNVLNLIS